MAAVQPPRTKSARLVAGFTNKTTHHAPASATHAHAHHGPSALSIFLTNLNLLDLDQHQDWPEICAETFATGGTSAQGLKKRVHCVEWALFQLFSLWDPEETKKKLKPFFPPLDQTQSVNLRAALLRALEAAKKNGVLGRDAIVRKTMLDECRGERLEDVLAAFSSAVLKHVIAQEVASGSEYKALALNMAIEDRGYKSDNTDLTTMVLAHRVAISRILNSKVAASSRFHDFADLLTVKEKGIARRREALNALEGGTTISDDARREMWRTLRNNWSGNERWMETLLYGDATVKRDGLLGMPFDRVWRRVQQGRLDELEEHGTGLLEQLDSRVRVQRERLQKWQRFRSEMSADQPTPSPSKVQPKEKENGIDFGFGAHEALLFGKVSPKKATFGKPKLLNEYEDLVRNLELELQDTKPQKSSVLDFLQRPAFQNAPVISTPALEPEEEEGEEVISELEDEDGFPESPIKTFKSKLDLSKRFPVRPKLSHTSDSFASVSSSTRSLRKPSQDEARILRASSVERTSSPEPEDEPIAASSRPEYDLSPQLSPHISPQPSPPPSPLPLQESPEQMPSQLSPTQDMADQILESMDMASPSPVKRPRKRHTLSLAERTRLTMARESFGDPEPDDLDITPPSTEPVSAEDPSQTLPEEEFDLLARTRKSMAGFDKARQKAQMERRRSLKKPKAPPKKEGSYFPKVEEDTTVITDELMAQEDMEAVFRSRPKIKASPLPSPTRDWDDDYV